MGFFDSLGAAKATGVALLIWAIGVFLVIGAAIEAKNKADDRTKINLVSGARPAKLVVNDQDVSSAEYQKVVDDLSKLHPSATIKTTGGRRGRGGNGVTITIEDVSEYYTFMIAIYDIMTSIPDARWSFDYFCAGDGCGREAYKAELKATRKKSTLVGG